MRCSPSTMRNTCRRKWPLRSRTRLPRARRRKCRPPRRSIAMAPELGIFSLILAFVLSLSQAFFGLTGAWRGKPVGMAGARPAVTGQFVFVVMAFACLVYSFVHNDFSVLYVARNSNSHLPLFYQVAAVWGAHEGSRRFWKDGSIKLGPSGPARGLSSRGYFKRSASRSGAGGLITSWAGADGG